MAFKVDYFTLVSSDATNKYVVLSGVPVDSSSVALDVIQGTAQAFPTDFVVDGTKVKWDFTASPLYSDLSLADQLRVIYDRS